LGNSFFSDFDFKSSSKVHNKKQLRLGLVGQAIINYTGGGDQEDHGLRPVNAKRSHLN
jgi:hypothetical protein